jgi:release factor glutamine methyltransferase
MRQNGSPGWMGSIRAVLASATQQLAETSQTPRLDAELLMAHALGISREALLLSALDGQASVKFDGLLTRRLGHEPVAYITGTRDFWTISLTVAPGVLVPRADSETLIEAAIQHFADRAPKRILDLGTGSGALLLAALDQWPEALGIGTDNSEKALSIAEMNAIDLGFEHRTRFILGDWAKGLDEQFDLILCNPPYVDPASDLPPEVSRHEPHNALFAGDHGLAEYRRLAPQIARLISPAGCAVVEIGFDQAASVSSLFAAEGLNVTVYRDLGERDRCLLLTR